MNLSLKRINVLKWVLIITTSIFISVSLAELFHITFINWQWWLCIIPLQFADGYFITKITQFFYKKRKKKKLNFKEYITDSKVERID